MSVPWTASAGGVRLSLRVTPNAGRDVIEGVETRPGAGPQLRVRVRDVPDKGRANKGVLKLLAAALGVPASSLTLVSGETARDKIIDISGDPQALASALEEIAAMGKAGRGP